MLQVNLHPAIEKKLPVAAQSAGMTQDAFVAQAIANAIEDWEDVRDAQEVMKNPGRIWTLEEIEQELGVTRP